MAWCIFHEWSRWSPVEKVEKYSGLVQRVQFRTCSVCGKTQKRVV